MTDDKRLERAIGGVLRVGVTASSICLAVGLALSLAGVAAPANLLLRTGLVVLMATPAGRVTVSAVEYAFARDWIFVGLTIIVLLELAGSVAVAIP
jgi:uncharacterized membrane protein